MAIVGAAARLISNSIDTRIYAPIQHQERESMRIPETPASWQAAPSGMIPKVNRSSAWVSRWVWVYLVGTVVTLLVVWSVRGAISIAIQPPPPCACSSLIPNPAVYMPALVGAVLFLVSFYVALFFVKLYADWAKERENQS